MTLWPTSDFIDIFVILHFLCQKIFEANNWKNDHSTMEI